MGDIQTILLVVSALSIVALFVVGLGGGSIKELGCVGLFIVVPLLLYFFINILSRIQSIFSRIPKNILFGLVGAVFILFIVKAIYDTRLDIKSKPDQKKNVMVDENKHGTSFEKPVSADSGNDSKMHYHDIGPVFILENSSFITGSLRLHEKSISFLRDPQSNKENKESPGNEYMIFRNNSVEVTAMEKRDSRLAIKLVIGSNELMLYATDHETMSIIVKEINDFYQEHNLQIKQLHSLLEEERMEKMIKKRIEEQEQYEKRKLEEIHNNQDTIIKLKSFISMASDHYYTNPGFIQEMANLVKKADRRNIRYSEYGQYFNNDFDLLCQVVKKDHSFNDDVEAKRLIWRALEYIAIDVFHDEWDRTYGHYFQNVLNKSLEKLCEDFCEASLIDSTNSANIGKFTYYLIKCNKFGEQAEERIVFSDAHNIIKRMIKVEQKNKKLRDFEKKLTRDNSKTRITMNDIDIMDGIEFENLVSKLFSKMGYKVNVTKGSGDQGIDVIAEKDGERIGIQTKRYSGKVGNTAIQEVVAGLRHYRCDKGIVVSNSYFTDSASDLAKSNNIMLWDRNMLLSKLDEFFP